jgi:hypothetical protein
MIILTISLMTLINGNQSFSDHIPKKKFAILHEDTELKGIVGYVNPDNNDLYIVPDPNYRHMFLNLGGNIIEPHDDSRPGWENVQNSLAECNLDPSQYPRPYPIIRLELYTFDNLPQSGNIPMIIENGQSSPVQSCDHISVRGAYVIDYAHTMYSDFATDSYCYIRFSYKGCHPHVELHPYKADSIKLVSIQPGEEVVESHTLVAPFYSQFYSPTWWWNKVNDVHGRVIDDTKNNTYSAEWFIQAPPQPEGGCLGGCKLEVYQAISMNSGRNN